MGGPWVQPQIDNPDYKIDNEIYKFNHGGVGIEIWQVKAGSIFDNILVTDSVSDAGLPLRRLSSSVMPRRPRSKRPMPPALLLRKRRWPALRLSSRRMTLPTVTMSCKLFPHLNKST